MKCINNTAYQMDFQKEMSREMEPNIQYYSTAMGSNCKP